MTQNRFTRRLSIPPHPSKSQPSVLPLPRSLQKGTANQDLADGEMKDGVTTRTGMANLATRSPLEDQDQNQTPNVIRYKMKLTALIVKLLWQEKLLRK